MKPAVSQYRSKSALEPEFLWKNCQAPRIIKALKCRGLTFVKNQDPGLAEGNLNWSALEAEPAGIWVYRTEENLLAPLGIQCWEEGSSRGKELTSSVTFTGSYWDRSGSQQVLESLLHAAVAECSKDFPCSLLAAKLLSFRPIYCHSSPTAFIVCYHKMSVCRASMRTRGWLFFGLDFGVFFRVFLLSVSPMWNLPHCCQSS